MDVRDEITWVVLELTPLGEKHVEEGTIETEIRKILSVDETWPIFVPSRVFEKEGKKVVIHLMEGYVFIGSGLDEIQYFKLENTRIGSKIMTQKGPSKMRVLHVLSNDKIEDLRTKMMEEISSNITVGMRVTPTEGPFRSLEGEVTSEDGDYVHVFFDFESKKIFKRINKIFLTAV